METLRMFLEKRYKIVISLNGIFILMLLYFTWCVSTISYQGNLYALLHCMCTFVTVSVYVLCGYLVKKYWKAAHIIRQYQVLNLVILLCFCLITVSDMARGDRSLFLMISDLLWIAAAEAVCYLFPYKFRAISANIVSWIRSHWQLLVLLALSTALAVYPTMLQFKWDGALYEQACWRMDIHSMSSMAAYSHLAQGYGFLFCMVRMLINNVDYAMAVTNLLMYMSSIAVFYGILETLLAQEKKSIWLIGTAVYAFSPFTLGMVNYYSLDYATLCLFICMLYFFFKREWLLQSVAAFLACFTKEPAIVVYGGLCIGIVIADYAKQNGSLKQKIQTLISRPQYYYMLLTALLWLVTYRMLGGWSSGNGGFDTALDSYVWEKCSVLYVLSFSWVCCLIVIIGMWMTRHKWKQEQWWLMPLLCSMVLFTLFSVMFKTVNHARYAGVIPGYLYIMCVFYLSNLLKNRWKQMGMTALAALLLVSSFTTIDPISWLTFQKVNTGNGSMLTTGMAMVGDSMIYNKQMLGFEYAVNQVIGDAIESNGMILLPTYEDNTNLYDGLMGTYEETEKYYDGIQYWDTDRHIRTLYESENTLTYHVYNLKRDQSAADVELVDGTAKRCYIYADVLGLNDAEKIMETYSEVECREYTYGIWKIYMLVF